MKKVEVFLFPIRSARHFFRSFSLKSLVSNICVFTLIFSSLLGTTSCGAVSSFDPMVPSLSSIKYIQAGGYKNTIHQFGKEQGADLLKAFSQLQPLSKKAAKKLHRGTQPSTDYISIVLYYGKDKKQAYFLFQNHKKWYLETKDGSIYKNAKVIVSAIHLSVTKSAPTSDSMTVTYDIPSKKSIELAKHSKTLDLRYFFATSVDSYIALGLSKEDSIKSTRKDFLTEECEYQYALHNGLLASKSKILQYEAQYKIPKDATTNLAELKNAYASAGYNYTDFKKKENSRSTTFYNYNYTNQALYDYIFKEFYDGVSDHVGKKECKDAAEYFNTYLTDIILPLSDTPYLSTFHHELDEAEAYYKTTYQKTLQ